jgi:epoxyqueuosine reductase
MNAPGTDETIERWTPELRLWLDASAREAGFDVAGVAPVLDATDPAAAREAARFADWIAAGRAGEMDYLKRRDDSGSLLRGSLRTAFPWARSVIVCALNYDTTAPRSVDPAPPGSGWIARYAWSGRTLADGSTAPTDYHDELLARLRRIEAALLARTACATRCYVDTGPLVERSLAAEAGVGWIGKNTCVLNQRLGSWLLLGVIVTSLPVEDGSNSSSLASNRDSADSVINLAADRCGTCTRCIDACPTNALLGSRDPAAPRTMDASLCIAYLTIEKKGDIPEPLREPIGRNVFGCDICQDVCPWNRKARSAPMDGAEGVQPRQELINPSLDWLAAMDSREFRRRFTGSPLERTGRKRLLRNVAIAMGNGREERFLPQLDEWVNAGSSDGAAGASSVAGNPNDRALRAAANWARQQILSRSADK